MLHLSPATGIFNENPVNNPGPSLAYDIKVPLWNKINYQRNDLKDSFYCNASFKPRGKL